MKKKVAYTLLALLALGGLAIALLRHNRSTIQTNLSFDKDVTTIGYFPIVNGLITTSRDMSFLVDTDSGVSQLAAGDVALLKAQGARVDSTMMPVMWRDNTNSMRMSTKVYTVDLPIMAWEPYYGLDGSIYYHRTDSVVNVIHNFNFVPASGRTSVIGFNFLKRFIVEYRAAENTIAFHTRQPEGYEPIIPITEQKDAMSIMGCTGLPRIQLDINGQSKDFVIDTSLDLVHVKMPEADTVYANDKIVKRVMLTDGGKVVRVLSSRNARARVGSRVGKVTVSYYDYADHDYSVNPFRFTSQDVLLDFPGHNFCYHAFTDHPIFKQQE